MHFAARYAGYSYGAFASDHKALVESNLRCLEDFDADAVGLISDPYRETAAFGARISFPEENVPVCEQPIIKTHEKVVSLEIPDVRNSERTRDRLLAARELRAKLGEDTPVIGWVEGPLAEAGDLAGVSEMYMKLMMDELFCRNLLEKTTSVAKAFAKAQIEAGCDIIGIGDAMSSQISAEQFQQYEKGKLHELIRFIQGKGAMVKLHICGDITHLLPDLAEIRPDILDIDWMVDMDFAYQVVGPEIIRCGNINPVEIEKQSEEAVYKMTRDLCEREKGRRFILSGGCEITVLTPPGNLKAMRQAQLDTLE
jgi:uroporphyrinogen decarboxylase